MKHTIPARVAASAAVLVLGVSLAACSSGAQGQEQFRWADRAVAAEDEEGSRIPLVVADDATDITVLIEERRFGAQLHWRSAKGVTADYCEPGGLRRTSTMTSPWWPKDRPGEGWTCGWWQAFRIGDDYYAWDTREGSDV